MKKFFKEFKEFISRGNVLDLAVGMIIGAAFTAIVTALVNGIFKPLINAIPMGDISGLITMLVPKNAAGETIAAGTADAVIDMTKSVYINWGDFIMAIVNFLLTAFILFIIVKAINTFRAGGKKLAEKQKAKIQKQLAKGKITEEEAMAATAEIEKTAEPAAPVETSDDLLREIRDLLKAKTVEENKKEEE